jgi:glycine/D-amino acid oxidase-like deaminating enzyme
MALRDCQYEHPICDSPDYSRHGKAARRNPALRSHSLDELGDTYMKSHARVVVIGGGVVGVSTLYHLTRKGWKDVVLLERTELTAGSTWHAAGLLPLFNMSYTVGQLHKYSVDLYKRLPAETGQEVSFHVNGNLRLATCAATHGRVPEVLRHREHHRCALSR